MQFPPNSPAAFKLCELTQKVSSLRVSYYAMYHHVQWFSVHRELISELLSVIHAVDTLKMDNVVPELLAVREDLVPAAGCSWDPAEDHDFGHARMQLCLLTQGRIDLYLPRLLDAIGLGSVPRLTDIRVHQPRDNHAACEYQVTYYASTDHWPGASLALLAQFIKSAYVFKASNVADLDRMRTKALLAKFYPQVNVNHYMDLLDNALLPEDIASLWGVLQAMSSRTATARLELPEDLLVA